MAFDLSLNLASKIAQLTQEVNWGVMTFPHILVYDQKDLDGLTKGRLKDSTWYFHDTEEAFLDTCEVLSKKFSVGDIYIRTAFWLMEVHYMDGENDLEESIWASYVYARDTYGVDFRVFPYMKDAYGRFTVSNVIAVARALSEHSA